MDSQTESSYSVDDDSDFLSNLPEAPNFEQLLPESTVIPSHELLTQAMNIAQIDSYEVGYETGDGSPSDLNSYRPDNDQILSVYDSNQIEFQSTSLVSQQNSIEVPSFYTNSNYIALPRTYSLADIPLNGQPSFTVKYYFLPYQDDNPCEWIYFDQNGSQVDNPTLLHQMETEDQFNLSNVDNLDLEPSTSGLVQLKHDPQSSTSADSASETIEPYPDHDYTQYSVEQPQPPVSPQMNSSPNDPLVQLEQSPEPSNLVANLFPNNTTQNSLPNELHPSYCPGQFAKNLLFFVNDDKYPQLKWSTDGHSIVFKPKLLEPVLGKFCRSTKMHNFIRQLYLYGFRKTNQRQLKRGRSISGVVEYQHQYFQRDQPELVDRINRRYSDPIKGMQTGGFK